MADKSTQYLRNTTGYNSGDWGRDNRGWDDGPQVQEQAQQDSIISDEQAKALDDTLAKGLGVILCLAVMILAIPALLGLLIGFAVSYSLFRFIRYRAHFIAGINAVLTVILGVLFMATGGINRIVAGYMSIYHNIKSGLAGPIEAVATGIGASAVPLAFLGIIIGLWVGLGFAVMQIRKMRNSPWLVESDSLASNKWMHDFTYRMSPFEKIKERKTIEGIKNDTLIPYNREDLTPLGIETEPLEKSSDPTKNKSYQVVCRAEDEVPKHTMVTGAAGSGKTVTLKSLMTRDIQRGNTIFVIDCKKDPEVAEFMSRMARDNGRNFYHYSADLPYKIQGNVEGPSSYDPISGLSPDKRVDMLLNIRKWDSSADVYRQMQQTYLAKVFKTLEVAEDHDILKQVKQIDPTQGEMWTFTQMLDRNIYNAVVTKMADIDDPQAQYVRQQASQLNAQLSPQAARTPEGKAVQNAQQELQSKMSGLMVSSYGRWLKGGYGGGSGKIIDISKLSSEPGNVVLFSIDAAQEGDIGSTIGALICSDLANMTETRKNLGQTNPISVYIDEFQSLPPDCVKSMLQKARSAGVGLTLAFQSLDQISAATGDDTYIKSLLDTCSNFIFHSGSNYDTGLMAAKIIGDHEVTKYVVGRRNETKIGAFNWLNNRDLQVSQHTERQWLVDPSSFAKLSMPNKQNDYLSEAIVIKKASSDPIDEGRVGASAHKVRMIAPDVAIHEWFDVNAPAIDIDAPMAIRVKSKALAQDINQAHAAVRSGEVDQAELELSNQDPMSKMQARMSREADRLMSQTVDDHSETSTVESEDGAWDRYKNYRRNQTGQNHGPTSDRMMNQNPALTRNQHGPTSARAMNQQRHGGDPMDDGDLTIRSNGMSMPTPESMGNGVSIPTPRGGAIPNPSNSNNNGQRRKPNLNGRLNRRVTNNGSPADAGSQGMPTPSSGRPVHRVPGPVGEDSPRPRRRPRGGLSLDDV